MSVKFSKSSFLIKFQLILSDCSFLVVSIFLNYLIALIFFLKYSEYSSIYRHHFLLYISSLIVTRLSQIHSHRGDWISRSSLGYFSLLLTTFSYLLLSWVSETHFHSYHAPSDFCVRSRYYYTI